MNWDDLKYCLAVARSGTFSAAAKQLQVNQTTVTRRIEGLVHHFGQPLFDRQDNQLIPTVLCQRLLDHAERVEAETANVERLLEDSNESATGIVRLTAVEGLMSTLLAPALPAFREQHPGIQLEMITNDANLNLSRREADIALRLARPAGGTAVTRKLTDLGMALYQAKDRGLDAWLGYDESMEHLPEARWLRQQCGGIELDLRTNSMRLLYLSCRQGMGRAVLPCYSADRDPDLVRVNPDNEPEITRELWLLIHPQARNSLPVKQTSTWLQELVRENRSRLTGTSAVSVEN